MKTIKMGGVEFGECDITHLSSSNAFKESMAGWGKQKPLGFTVYMTEAQFLTLLETTAPGSYNRATYNWLVMLPDAAQPTTIGSLFYATAWTKDISFSEASSDNDDALTVDIELQPTGRPDWSTSSTGP